MKIYQIFNLRKEKSLVKINQFFKKKVVYEKNQFLNFRKDGLPVKIDQFMKWNVVYENRLVSKIQKWQVTRENIPVSEKGGHS